ncbi:MAG: cytochrome d ubiquinol oxidase subunit II [Myxococcales bacterium]|nr:MAG: cytochrome d ubiquinol oxidase subunit II [Myxococcales bacterium]
MTLQIIWFFLVAVLIIGYAILDGFDLGVGFWHFFAKDDREQRTLIQSIGPFWDGNEVWLLTGGGAIFAAFPPVYATVFSGFYLALMLVLFALIFRAVAIEMRNQEESRRWRKAWDVAFGLGSSLPALLFGVALGNILRGLPLNAHGDYTGGFFGLLNPYSLLIGLVGFAMLAVQGALWIALKTENSLQARAFGWAKVSWIGFAALFVAGTIASLFTQPQHLSNYGAAPVLWLLPILAVLAIGATGFLVFRKDEWKAFLASSVSIALMLGLAAAAIFPNLVPALDDPGLSLTIYNASSSQLTLTAMLIIALIGMPLVLAYTIWVYRFFKGKVRVDEAGYGH